MPSITFQPEDKTFEVLENTKVLAVAVKNKVEISFSCGACQCGLCFFNVEGNAQLSEIEPEEKKMLGLLDHPTDGSVRMACKTKILNGNLVANLSKNLNQ